MPMVMTSNWPPLVAMSVVTRWRSVPSSSVTHLSLMSGLACSKFFESFCISIMWPLLTVAITSSVAAWAMPVARTEAAMRAESLNFTWVSFFGCLHGVLGRGGIVTNPDACIDTKKGESDTLLLHKTGNFPNIRLKV